MAAKRKKTSKTSRRTACGTSEKKLLRVKQQLLKCVASIDKTLSPAQKMQKNWDRSRKHKGFVPGNSPNLVPDWAK